MFPFCFLSCDTPREVALFYRLLQFKCPESCPSACCSCFSKPCTRSYRPGLFPESNISIYINVYPPLFSRSEPPTPQYHTADAEPELVNSCWLLFIPRCLDHLCKEDSSTNYHYDDLKETLWCSCRGGAVVRCHRCRAGARTSESR